MGSTRDAGVDRSLQRVTGDRVEHPGVLMKRLVSRQAVAIVVVVGLALGGTGVALAGFVDGGPGSGSATTGFPTSFTVSSPIFTGGPLYPGQGGDGIVATIQNATGTSLPLNLVVVSISSVTMNPPGSLYAQQPGVPPCTTADYALQAPFPGTWTGGVSNGPIQRGQALSWFGTGAPIPSGDYVVGGLPNPAIGNVFVGSLAGLKL